MSSTPFFIMTEVSCVCVCESDGTSSDSAFFTIISVAFPPAVDMGTSCTCVAGTDTAETVLDPGVCVGMVAARDVSDSGGDSLATDEGGKVGG